MMTRLLGTRAIAAREAIAALCDQPIDPRELVHEVSERVRRVVPYDWSAWSTTDPETLLGNDVIVADPEDCELAALTQLGLASGERHRRLFAPRGLREDTRLLARSGDTTWGMASLARATDARAFSAGETAFVTAVAEHLGDGLRANLARSFIGAAPGSAGTLVLDAEMEIVGVTAQARDWLERMPSTLWPDYLPPAIESVALHAQARAIRPARLRLRIPGEGWLHVRADRLESVDDSPPRTVVTIEPAGRAELLPIALALYGLTERERAVATLLLGGHDTQAVAERLEISRHTLRDHVKAIFAKTGVRSRPQLTVLLGAEAPAA